MPSGAHLVGLDGGYFVVRIPFADRHTDRYYESFMDKVPAQQLLNKRNGLTVYRVSPSIAPELVEESLRLAERLFPREKTARQTLGKVYESLMAGQTRISDFEVLSFFIYTVREGVAQRVVGGSGLYRLVEYGPEVEVTLKLAVPMMQEMVGPSWSPLSPTVRGEGVDFRSLLWGGRLFVDRSASLSPAMMPFIMHHILSTARLSIETRALAPFLLAYTEVAHNDAVRGFYEKLGFVPTPATFEAAGAKQQVFALHLPGDSAAIERLERITLRWREAH